MQVDVEYAVRPLLRGRLHQLAAVAALVGLVVLVRSAETTAATVAAWIYGLTGILLYATSSSYHVFARSPRARRIMQRADHSMIYVLIAGSFTPTAVLALDGGWQVFGLALMWAGALAGIVLKTMAFDRFQRLGGALYIVLGWAGIVALPALWGRPGTLALVVAAGVIYTVGAILFALHWPTLSPRWFGYHEVWHCFVVAAGALLFVANLGLIDGAA